MLLLHTITRERNSKNLLAYVSGRTVEISAPACMHVESGGKYIYELPHSAFFKVKILRFWSKTMDYSQAFQSDFFLPSKFLTGRCYGAEMCAILLLLRCPFK